MNYGISMKELKTGRGVFNRYCREIMNGKIPACGYVKKAVERCLKDFEKIPGTKFEYEFDWDTCEKFWNFSKTIPLPDKKDEKLDLLPWQVFSLFNLTGWVYKNNRGKRRFRSGMIQVPRKNGKTTGLMYPLLIWDFITSASAESYFFEKDEPQARKVYKELQDILSRHELLKDRIESNIFSIYSGNKRIAYFTSESIGIDGYRPSMAIIDEYWCFPADKPLTAMRYGGRSRDSSLALIITTAGTDISLPCYDETMKAKKILNGVYSQDDYFCIIYGIDDDVKWDAKEAYIMANPSLKDREGRGIIDPKLLDQDLHDAVNQPSHRPDYLAKTLNVWTIGTSSWIPVEKLRFSGDTDFSLFGNKKYPCYGALDLSAVNDWTAYTLCFNKDDRFYFKHRFYIPLSTINERYRKENINILKWIDQGQVTVINSDTIDYDYILKDIKKDYETFDIREIAYDNWGSQYLINAIEDNMPGIITLSLSQSLKFMSQPTKELEKRILDRKIETDCGEIITWMLSNVQIKPDPNGNYKPLKNYSSSSGRIDGVITMIMSLFRCMANKNETNVSFEDILNMF
jgi:phage terminase large subunit-like protein